MDRLFFRGADAAVAAAVPAGFSAQMLRAAPAPQQQGAHKQKGKTLRWSQEEASRRAICSRNKLVLTQAPTALPFTECEDFVVAGGRASNADATGHVAPSSCNSITDIIDDSASEFSSPRSPAEISPSGSSCIDVEIRRTCSAAHDAPWSPALACESANALMNSGLLSPVLQFSRMSLLDLQPLSSTLDVTDSDLGCADAVADGEQAKIVPETPSECAHVRDSDASGSSHGIVVEENRDGQEHGGFGLWKTTGSCEVVAETPLKHLPHPSPRNAPVGCASYQRVLQDLCADITSIIDEQEMIHAWFQAQAQNLQRVFPSAAKSQSELPAECCGGSAMLTSQNGAIENSKPRENADSLPAVAPDQQQEQQLSSTMLVFSTLQAAVHFYSSHLQQV